MQRITQGTLHALLPTGMELWLDGGHNPAAGEALAAILDEWHARAPRPVHAIAGMLNTKGADEFLRPLGPRLTSLRTVTIPNAPASFSAAELAEIASTVGITAQKADSVAAALEAAAQLGAPARVLICGSLYLAGEVLRQNQSG